MSAPTEETEKEATTLRRDRYRKAAEKLRQWALEDREYDERVGAILNEELKDSVLKCGNTDELPA